MSWKYQNENLIITTTTVTDCYKKAEQPTISLGDF